MTLEVWLVYTAVYFVICLTPGPAVLFVASQSAWRGRPSGIAAALGIESANAVYWALSALGLAAAIAASQMAFLALKWAGALYLAWLGVQAIMGSFRRAEAPAADAPVARYAYRDGLIVGLSNPKAMLFFVALVPQFVDPAAPALAQIAILAATGMAVDFATNAGYAFAAGTLRRALARSAVKRWFDRTVGAVFISLATLAALYRRAA